MPRYQKDINAIYISERMQENLRRIKDSTMTSIVAPMGYGKTTAALWYLDERRAKGDAVFRVNLYSSDVTLFWQSFCAAFRGTPLGDRLEGMDFPDGQTAVNLLISAMTDYLSTLEHDLFLVLDDCHLMEDGRVFAMLFALCDIPTRRLHIMVISRSAMFMRGEELHLGSRLHKITVDDMRLNRTELAVYLRRCGVELPDDAFETLFRNSEGWFSCVYLNLRNYVKTGALLSSGEDIYSMIGESLYAGYDEAEQRFFLQMCLADEFSVAQAEFITGKADTQTVIRSLARNNAFIRYLPDTDTFRFHHMLRGYVEKLFSALPDEQQRALRLRYGAWHEGRREYIPALRFYHDAGAMAELLRVIGLDRGVLLASVKPEQVLGMLAQCSEAELIGEPAALLVLMRRMFTCRQIPKMLELKGLLMKAAARPDLSEEEKGNIIGESDLIMSFLRYNDISAMSELHQSAARMMTRPAISIQNSGSWTFSSPSVLMMFHREAGGLDAELAAMNTSMPYYYQMTDGHGLGAEQIMAAEAHYNRGQFDDAHILLERARATVEGTGQHYILLCCDLLAERLALCGKLPYRADWASEKRDLLKTLHDPMLFTVLDGCSAYIHALRGEPDAIPDWIRAGKLAEANLLAPGRPMFEVIYNQVLLRQRQYATVIGRSDALLGACRGLHYLLCEIHLLIQLAIARDALGKSTEALDALKQALDLALPDGILMPFVENGESLAPLLAQLPATYAEAAAQIGRLMQSCQIGHDDRPDPLAALTERERTVAALYGAGKTRREIAESLYLSEGTVKNYISTVYDKLALSGTPKQKQHALAKLFADIHN